jgi:hypothetical protein
MLRLYVLLLVNWLLAAAVPARAQTQLAPPTSALAVELALRTQTQWASAPLTAADLRIGNSYTDAVGLTYVYAQQVHEGVPVYNQVVTLVFKAGQLRHHAGSFRPRRQFASLTAVPKVPAATAVATAVAMLPGAPVVHAEALGSPSGSDQQQSFGLAGVARRPMVARLVWAVTQQGQPRLAWNVNVDVLASADWLNIRVDALTGQVLGQDNWTVHEAATRPTTLALPRRQPAAQPQQRPASLQRTQAVTPASYYVVPYPRESPAAGSLQTESNPWQKAGPGNNATTHGWHFDGTTNYTDTRGNNVWAYDDSLKLNVPGRFTASTGTSGSLVFNDVPDFTKTPTLGRNRRAATTNLFYWNNLMHDVLYQYGFTEASGNFQTDNQGRGGTGNDHVRAEAQDGSGLNNANFSTPPDGTSGRMQMYLYSARAAKVNVTAPSSAAASYNAFESNFSTNNKLVRVGGITGPAVYFDDANSNPTTHTACGTSATSLTGKIALIIDVGCTYVAKAKAAQAAGAIGVIVLRNAAGASAGVMGGSDNTITIPAVMVSNADGITLANLVNSGLMVSIPSTGFDGDYDNGIVSHEFGHGVSNRLTGGGTNTSCLYNAEQAGEGWSDYFALLMTTDWATAQLTDGPKSRGGGAYAAGLGAPGATIRRYPYSTDMTVNPLTYANMATSTEVHDIGEIWCATLWDMTWNIIQQQNSIEPNLYNSASTGGNAVALSLVMQGLKLQPCQPGFLDSRDAILAADSLLYNGQYHCAIWSAFARRGMGFSAREGASTSATDQTVAYDQPGVRLNKRTTPLVGNQFIITLSASCDCQPPAPVSITDQLPAGLQYVSSTGGRLNGNTVTFANLSFGQGQQRTFQIVAQTAPGAGCAIVLPVNDNRETTTVGGLTPAVVKAGGNNAWAPTTTRAYSGTTAWAAIDPSAASDVTLTSAAFTPTAFSLLSFYHFFSTESTYDGGMVAISVNNGGWQDAAAYFLQNGYNSAFATGAASVGKPCFSGLSSELSGAAAFQQSVLNLSSFSGQSIRVRFQFQSDTYNEYGALPGWFIDDILVQNGCGGLQRVQLLNNASTVTDSYTQPIFITPIGPPTIASFSPNPAGVGIPVTLTGTSLLGARNLVVNGVTAPITGNTPTTVSFVVPAGAVATGTTSLTADFGTVSSPDFRVLAAPGNALALDGQSNYLTLPAATVADLQNDFTLEYWVRTTQASPAGTAWWQGTGLLDGEVSGPAADYGTSLLNGKVAFGVGGGTNGTDVTITSQTTVNDGRWHYVAATRTASTGAMRLYLDGQLEASGTGNTAPLTAPPALQLGGIQTGSNFLAGSFDELRLWSVVRAAADIQAAYLGGPAAPTAAGLVGYYSFDEGTPGGTNTGLTTLYDLTANARHLDLPGSFALTGLASNWVESYALVVPVATAATNVASTGFTANWTTPSVGQVGSYLLDVSASSTFASGVATYAVAAPAGSYAVSGSFAPNTTHYYRVRAEKAGLAPQSQGAVSPTVAVPVTCVAQAVARAASVSLDNTATATVTTGQLNNNSTTNCAPLALSLQKVVYGEVAEGGTLTLTAPAGAVFTAITFASYGTPTGTSGNYIRNDNCHASNSLSVASAALLNKNSGTITVSNALFSGDPCPNTLKKLAVVAAYTAPASSLIYTCAETGTSYAQLTASTSTNSTFAVVPVTVSVPPTPTTTWNGSASTAWTDCANWSFGKVPDASTDVVIPATASRLPVPTGTIAVHSLTTYAAFTTSSSTVLQLHGDLQLGGAGTFNGPVAFVGSGTQTVTGSGTITFSSLTLAKPTGTVQLQRDISVSNLTMTSGLLSTASFRVSLGSTGTLTETETSYVLGNVAATRTLAPGVSQSFGGLGLALAPAAGSASPGSTAVVRTTGNILTGVGTSQSIKRYFDIQPTTNRGLNVELTFAYFTHELNNIPVANLTVFKAEATTGPWQGMGSSSAGPNYVTRAGISDFSIWTLGNLANPLPVKLVSFTATAQSRTAVQLAWATASEVNSAYFEVERSLDGSTFTPAGRVAAAGNSTTAHPYSLLDNSLPASVSLLYYRLRQVDLDGTATYSPVRTVQLANAGLALYPNPARGQATLLGAEAGTVVRVLDALGRVVLSTTADAAGAAQLALPAGLASGVYLVRTSQQTLRLSVE